MPEFDEVSRNRFFQAIENNDLNELNALVGEEYPVSTATFDDNGSTALHIALSSSDIRLATVKKLVELGCDLHSKNSQDQIPLEIAITNRTPQRDILKFIYEQCGDTLSNEQTCHLLACACLNENLFGDGSEQVSFAQIPTEHFRAIGDIESSKMKKLELPVDEEITDIISELLSSSKKLDIFAKESIIESIYDLLGEVFQLSSLFNLAYGSGFLPFYHQPGGDPDDEFGGGNSAIIFDGEEDIQNSHSIILLENGTFVFLEEI
ncbi:MAG: hypothetical protein N4A31_06670 [Rickettsiales bacterium]|jgi:hypothetical protein|nr:hypothetical protein [Rickettsiales bacterium]